MRLLTIELEGESHPAICLDTGQVLDLRSAPDLIFEDEWRPRSLRGVLELSNGIERLKKIRDVAEENIEQLSSCILDDDKISLLPPVPDPWLILSVGMNYGQHLAEMDNTPRPKHPAAFIKTRDTLLGSGRSIEVPRQCSDMIDYEGEMSFVFGKMCHNVNEQEAMDYIVGYTIANDVSARNWIPDIYSGDPPFGPIHGWERNIMGKNLPGFTPCGPVIVTKDEIDDVNNLRLQTKLNGEVMQNSNTDDLIFKIPEIVSYFSKWYRFHPGDIITTGSPSGVGVGRDPQVFMKAGDRIEVEIENIGILANELV